MKKVLLLLLLAGVVGHADAAMYSGTGTVQAIISKDRANYTADNALITGFSSAGSCGLNGGLVAVAMHDDESGKKQFATLLAARVAGLTVNVQVDDTIKTPGGACYLQILTM